MKKYVLILLLLFPLAVSADLVLVITSKVFISGEEIVGVKNGVNTSFAIANDADPDRSLKIYINGIRQDFGVHFTTLGTGVTILEAPESGDKILADYEFNQ